MQHPNPDPSYFSVLIKHNPAGNKANPVSEVNSVLYRLFFYAFMGKIVFMRLLSSLVMYFNSVIFVFILASLLFYQNRCTE